MSKPSEDKEKKELLKFFAKMDKELLKDVAGVISTLVRAFEGKPPEGEDAITWLTNVKNILERSRFPTYPLLQKQVYLRLLHKFAEKEGSEEGQAYEDWANAEAQALISYKGKSREEYTEQLKHASGAIDEGQRIVFGMSSPQPQKRGFLRGFRKPKEGEESEFTAQ